MTEPAGEAGPQGEEENPDDELMHDRQVTRLSSAVYKRCTLGRGVHGEGRAVQVNLRVRKFDSPETKLYTTLHFIPNFRFVSNFRI